MDYKFNDIIDVVGSIVDSMRETGDYNPSFDGTYTLCDANNTLSANDIITINDIDYIVIEASSTLFKVKGDVSAYSTYKAKAPYYEYGNALEIADTLSKKDKSTQILAFQKYPLIWLRLDVTAEYDKKFNLMNFNNVQIYIVNITNPDYKAKDRKEKNFDPILTPLYNNFIKALRKNEYINHRNGINFENHAVTNRYFWGSSLLVNYSNSGKNIFNDYLDAVDISKLNLSIKPLKNC